jgi:hypothetical protein
MNSMVKLFIYFFKAPILIPAIEQAEAFALLKGLP